LPCFTPLLHTVSFAVLYTLVTQVPNIHDFVQIYHQMMPSELGLEESSDEVFQTQPPAAYFLDGVLAAAADAAADADDADRTQPLADKPDSDRVAGGGVGASSTSTEVDALALSTVVNPSANAEAASAGTPALAATAAEGGASPSAQSSTIRGNAAKWLSEYLGELALQEYDLLQYVPSLVATCAVSLALYCTGKDHWPPTLRQASQYDWAELKDCMLLMIDVYRRSPGAALAVVRKRYTDEKRGGVAQLQPPTQVRMDW
jgi:hypothetical protein